MFARGPAVNELDWILMTASLLNLESIYACYTAMRRSTPLVRADFSDDATWSIIVGAVTRPAFFDDRDDIEPLPEDPDNPPYQPDITPISDQSFDGVTLEKLIQAWVPPEHVGYLLLADARSFREARAGEEITVVYADLRDNDEARTHPDWWPEWRFGLSFRCATRSIAIIECNLGLANTSFSDHYDQQAPDGVVRWHP